MFFQQRREGGRLVNMANLDRYPEAITRTGAPAGEGGTAAGITGRLEGLQATR